MISCIIQIYLYLKNMICHLNRSLSTPQLLITIPSLLAISPNCFRICVCVFLFKEFDSIKLIRDTSSL